MLIAPDRKRAQRVRDVLREARDTYRRHSGASDGDAPLPVPAERAEPVRRRKSVTRPEPAAPRPPKSVTRPEPAAPRPPDRRDDPDVLLDVPRLHVDDIELKLDELHARVALEAHVLDLVRLDVGVTADLRGVDLEIAGVDAQALLKVRLDNLAQIVDRVMSTIDRNPQLLDGLVRDLGRGLGAGAGALRRAA